MQLFWFVVVSGLLEYESIPGVSHSKPFGMRNFGGKSKVGSSRPGAGAYTVESIVKEVGAVLCDCVCVTGAM